MTKNLGYVGKSLVLGSVGITATLIAACGGGGVTDVIAQSAPSPYVLFASGYKEVPGAADTLKAQTLEGGYVYAGSDGTGFKWGTHSGGTWTDDAMQARGAFGLSYQQDIATVDDTSFAYVAVKAPGNESVDISQSEKIVIRTGNGTTLQYDLDAKKVFRIILSGGTQSGAPDYSYPLACYNDLTLNPDAISDSGADSANPFGQRTYEISLDNFTCSSGTLADLKKDLREVTVKIQGGIDGATDNSTAQNYTFIQAGAIAFTK